MDIKSTSKTTMPLSNDQAETLNTTRSRKKPPLGIEPELMWKERRLEDLKNAIHRYINEYCLCPIEWIKEYNKLLAEILQIRQEF